MMKTGLGIIRPKLASPLRNQAVDAITSMTTTNFFARMPKSPTP
jgi:hypothetical protein